MTVLGEARKQLSQEYATAGKTSTFEALKVFLDPNNAITPPSYDEVANRIQVTTGAVKTLIHRLRKRYTALLREEVGRTVSDPAEIDALCDALVASEGLVLPLWLPTRSTGNLRPATPFYRHGLSRRQLELHRPHQRPWQVGETPSSHPTTESHFPLSIASRFQRDPHTLSFSVFTEYLLPSCSKTFRALRMVVRLT